MERHLPQVGEANQATAWPPTRGNVRRQMALPERRAGAADRTAPWHLNTVIQISFPLFIYNLWL